MGMEHIKHTSAEPASLPAKIREHQVRQRDGLAEAFQGTLLGRIVRVTPPWVISRVVRRLDGPTEATIIKLRPKENPK